MRSQGFGLLLMIEIISNANSIAETVEKRNGSRFIVFEPWMTIALYL